VSLKKENNSLLSSFWLVLGVLIFIVAYSFAYDYSPFLQSHFKDVPAIQQKKVTLFFASKRLTKQKIKNVYEYQIQQKDLLRFQAELDSIQLYNSYAGKDYLHFFYEALKHRNKSSVRIAYIGDSTIEGDLMSMTLRNLLQNKYGGKGIGFVPITSKTAGFRTTISHQFSDNWKYASIVVGNPTSFNYGFSGEIFYYQPDSLASDSIGELWVKYANNSTLGKAKLYYGRNDSITTTPNVLQIADKKFKLKENKFLNELVIKEEATNHLNLEFEMNHPMPIYGVSFASETGVIVDNYSSRSNSGMPLSLISSQMLQEYQNYMQYDLVILQFGLNAIGKKEKQDYSWYKAAMKRVINKYKAAMPGASFLLISVGDKSEKNEDGEMYTSENVINMVATQREIARESEVAFFNLFEAMGGENSMVDWVENKEWANKDYTHFNYKGAKVATDSLYQFLMQIENNNE